MGLWGLLKNCCWFRIFDSNSFGFIVLLFISISGEPDIDWGLLVLIPVLLKKFGVVFEQIVFTVFGAASLRILFLWLNFSWLIDVA